MSLVRVCVCAHRHHPRLGVLGLRNHGAGRRDCRVGPRLGAFDDVVVVAGGVNALTAGVPIESGLHDGLERRVPQGLHWEAGHMIVGLLGVVRAV